MRRMQKIQGMMVPNLTPMFADGSLDLDGYGKLAETFLASPAVGGLFSIGASGEYMCLDVDDRKRLIEVLASLDGRGKAVFANIGGMETEGTMLLAKFAADKNIDGLIAVVPTHLPDEQGAIVDYYKQIASCGKPFMLYQPPSVTTHQITPALIEELMEIPEFVGFKDSSRDMEKFSVLCANFASEVSVLQGVEMLYLPSLACGCSGIVGGGGNLYPAKINGIGEAFGKGDMDTAIKLQQEVTEGWYNIAENFRTLVKSVWKSRGVIKGAFSRKDGEMKIDPARLQKSEEMLSI